MQICLDKPSSFLTTFNTPVGRYHWLRLPYGLKYSPEYSKQMLEGIEWETAVMDDILVAGCNIRHHDYVLKRVMQWAASYNLQLNFRKCQIQKSSVPYIGHLLTAEGVQLYQFKTEAVEKMPRPTEKQSVQCFLGFVQYLGRFIPNVSDTSKPLPDVCKTDVEFTWQLAQE